MKHTGVGDYMEFAGVDFGDKDFTIEHWFHFALSRKDGETYMYMDGKLYNPNQLDMFAELEEQYKKQLKYKTKGD